MNPLAKKVFFLTIIFSIILFVQACALKPTKDQQREMAFNMVFNVMTIKTAATAYSIANMFSFSTNKVLESFNEIAESDDDIDRDRVTEFATLSEKMPVKLMMVIDKFQPKVKDLVFKKPEYIDKFIETDIFQQGLVLSRKASDFDLPDLTEELDQEQIGLWMQAFMSSKPKVKSIADPLSEWSEQVQKYFEMNL